MNERKKLKIKTNKICFGHYLHFSIFSQKLKSDKTIKNIYKNNQKTTLKWWLR